MQKNLDDYVVFTGMEGGIVVSIIKGLWIVLEEGNYVDATVAEPGRMAWNLEMKLGEFASELISTFSYSKTAYSQQRGVQFGAEDKNK